jgi:hypothetical protein
VVSSPYTGIFDRVSQAADGFVVDQPIHLSTLLESGFLMLKVWNKGISSTWTHGDLPTPGRAQ